MSAITELLEDAKMVAMHGARAGTLPDGAPLFKAIKAAEAATPAFNWGSDEAVALQRALSQAIRSIRPVTLHDLKSGWRVDRPSGTKDDKIRNSTLKWFLVLATAAVMAICADLTIWRENVATFMTEFSDDPEIRSDAAIHRLVILTASMASSEQRTLADPDAIFSATLQSDYREIESVKNDLLSKYSQYQKLRRQYLFKDVPSIFGSTRNPTRSQGDNPGGFTRGQALAADAPAPPAFIPASATQTDNPEASAEANLAGCIDKDLNKLIAESRGALADINESPIDHLMMSHQYYTTLVHKVRCSTGLESVRKTVQSANGGASSQGSAAGDYYPRDMDYHFEMLGLWLLPAFYGVLGALIYHLRAFLTDLRPDPTFTKVIVRVGLSAFAGTAIGWLWSPESGAFGDIPGVAVAPLTIAFLVGFSIDVFFAFLDRLVTIANRWVSGIGETAQPS